MRIISWWPELKVKFRVWELTPYRSTRKIKDVELNSLASGSCQFRQFVLCYFRWQLAHSFACRHSWGWINGLHAGALPAAGMARAPKCACPHGNGHTKELCGVMYRVYYFSNRPHSGCGRHVCSTCSHSSLYEQSGDLHSFTLGAVTQQKRKSLLFPQQLVRRTLAGVKQYDAVSPCSRWLQ